MKNILFDDNHIIIYNKPAGMLVQGDKTGDKCLLDEIKLYIKKMSNKPGEVYLGLPHRLDRPTSGIVIMARTSKALTRLTQMFAKNEIKKTYWAIVSKRPDSITAKLTHFLVKDEKTNKSKAYDKPHKNTKEAILEYNLINSTKDFSLLEVNLHTGRHHQIRVQLSKIGCPIIGDLKYGSGIKTEDGNILLHSRKVAFIHPVKKELIEIIAPPPVNEYWKQL